VKQIAEDFFTRFAAQLSTAPPVTEPEVVVPTPVPPSLIETTAGPVPREGLAPEIWVIGLVGVIVILLVLFGVAL
jgi:hypothetical protein